MTHLLDTSALLAFYLQEPGLDAVKAILKNPDHEVGLSAPSVLEFWSALHRRNLADRFEAEWQLLQPLFSEVVPVTETVAVRAIQLRRQTPARLPAIDALIAATAAVHGAVLVHRDPHFRAIPENLLRQEYLG
jgi:predicted nucleic acid-binding protein